MRLLYASGADKKKVPIRASRADRFIDRFDVRDGFTNADADHAGDHVGEYLQWCVRNSCTHFQSRLHINLDKLQTRAKT